MEGEQEGGQKKDQAILNHPYFYGAKYCLHYSVTSYIDRTEASRLEDDSNQRWMMSWISLVDRAPNVEQMDHTVLKTFQKLEAGPLIMRNNNNVEMQSDKQRGIRLVL